MVILAVGDVVNGIGSVATAFSFQPAVGVEILISSVGSWENRIFGINDGVKNAWIGKVSSEYHSSANVKVFINNTNYLYIQAPLAGEYACYTGIQIK